MRSPFSIFRKYQKITMVIILFLTMVAFTVSDALTNYTGEMPIVLIVVMTGMIGAAIGAFIGMQTGKPWEYAIAGVVVGAVVSFVASSAGGTEAAVETTAGDLSSKDLESLVARRQTANSFVTEAYQRVAPPPQMSNPFLMQFWESRLRQLQFSNGLSISGGKPDVVHQSLEDDVLFGYLLEQEAEKMGISISDDAVNAYIKSIGSFGFGGPEKQLTRDQFREIRERLHVSESELYDALRGELRVRTALHTLAPSSLQAPEEYWKVYRQLHVKEKLDVAAVPVDDFTKEVADPSQAELDEFFDRYRQVYPGQLGPDAPGFLQSRKFELAYLEASFKEFEKKVPAVTDAEIEDFYIKNKENYKNNPFPDPGKNATSPQNDPDLNNPLDVNITPEGGPGLSPESKTPAPQPQEGDKPADRSEDKAQSGKEDAPPANHPPADGKKPDVDEGNKKPPESKSEPNKGAGLPRNVRQKMAALPAIFDPIGATALFGVLADEPAGDAGKAKPTESEIGSDEKPSDESSKPASPSTDDEQKSGSAPQQEAQPSGEKTDVTDGSGSVRAPKPGEKQTVPEYRPLDDDLRADIREELLKQRTRDLMKETIRDASEVIFRLRNQYITVDESNKRGITAEEIAARLQKIAEEHGLTYHHTGYLSALELRDGAADSIGTATDPQDGQFNPGTARPVWQRMLQSAPVQLYDPMTVESPVISDLYAVWKTGDQDEHLPELDEPGVREKVVSAWKMDKARPAAEKRAGELAELVRSSKKGMAGALGGQSVTGKEDGSKITTRLTESFSWLRESAAPETDIFQRSPPRVSDVAAIKNISNDFMKIIFDQMSDGDVRAIPNRDKSVYYVVQVTERFPSTPEDENAFRQTFLRENLFMGMFGETPYRYQMRVQDSRAHLAWVQELRKRYGVRWTELGRPAPVM